MSSNMEDHQWPKILYARPHLLSITLLERALMVATKPEVSRITSALTPSTHSYHRSHINPNISLLKLQATLRDWGRKYERCCEHRSSPRTHMAILHCFSLASCARCPRCTGWGCSLHTGTVENMEAALVFYHHKLLTTRTACFKCITMLLSL